MDRKHGKLHYNSLNGAATRDTYRKVKKRATDGKKVKHEIELRCVYYDETDVGFKVDGGDDEVVAWVRDGLMVTVNWTN